MELAGGVRNDGVDCFGPFWAPSPSDDDEAETAAFSALLAASLGAVVGVSWCSGRTRPVRSS